MILHAGRPLGRPVFIGRRGPVAFATRVLRASKGHQFIERRQSGRRVAGLKEEMKGRCNLSDEDVADHHVVELALGGIPGTGLKIQPRQAIAAIRGAVRKFSWPVHAAFFDGQVRCGPNENAHNCMRS